MKTPRRIVFALAVTLAAAAQLGTAATAQFPRPSTPYPQPTPATTGTMGNDTLWGTLGSDNVTGGHGGTDVLHDAVAVGDGVFDVLDTVDGDNNDQMWGGPEDAFLGDLEDTVNVYCNGRFWTMTAQQAQRTQAFLRWLQDRAQAVLALLNGMKPPPGFWGDLLLFVRNELKNFKPSVGDDGLISFAENFELGPYYVGSVPSSPGGFLLWLPYGETDPVVATSELRMTADEYESAVDTALGFVDAAIAALTDSDADE